MIEMRVWVFEIISTKLLKRLRGPKILRRIGTVLQTDKSPRSLGDFLTSVNITCYYLRENSQG